MPCLPVTCMNMDQILTEEYTLLYSYKIKKILTWKIKKDPEKSNLENQMKKYSG